ncbi:MAG TPA: PDZ domain-containing protein [Polyangiaceae bacterium]|nr:PDZ domain-containing protein [Polyangiaceae bacterium]
MSALARRHRRGGARGRLAPVLAGAVALGACGPPPGTIGAVLARAPDGSLRIDEAPAGLAAAEAGLEPGDQILLIDGVDVRALDAEAVHAALSGDVGEPVKLTVIRDDEVLRVTLARTPVPARERAPRRRR